MHKFVKAVVFVGGALGVLWLIVALSIFKISIAIAYRTFDVHATPVTRLDDPASRAQGAHLVNVVLGCTDCHGDDLGGKMVIDDPATGRIAAPNLTRGDGGRPKTYEDIDFVRAIRHGVDPIDRGLWLMPTRAYASLSDTDLGRVLADIAARPPVARAWPDVALTWRGRAKVAFRQVSLLQVTEEALPTVPAVAPDTTAAYGTYLARIAGCVECHGGAAGAGTLTRLSWTPEEFTQALREGRRPDGSAMHASVAGKRLRGLDEKEIAALWAYVQTLSP
jgi:mono/diheme cytochrome c family protein